MDVIAISVCGHVWRCGQESRRTDTLETTQRHLESGVEVGSRQPEYIVGLGSYTRAQRMVAQSRRRLRSNGPDTMSEQKEGRNEPEKMGDSGEKVEEDWAQG